MHIKFSTSEYPVDARPQSHFRIGFTFLGLVFLAMMLISDIHQVQAIGLNQPQGLDPNCIHFFDDENYGGSHWSFCSGVPSPPHGAWNDEVTSMIVPRGLKLLAYQHTKFGGSRKDFIGEVPNVGGDFNDEISSFKTELFDSSNCVIAYEDENYGGESWAFCPSSSNISAPDHGRWNDNISSLKMPANYKVKLCTDLDHDGAGKPVGRGHCRSYFRDVPLIGPSANDEYSFIQRGPFQPDNFFMVVMSDPQYFMCENAPCQDLPGVSGDQRSAKVNQWHAASMKKVADLLGFSNFAGIIVNGDITHLELENEMDSYLNDYERSYQFNIWPGFGNHDYDNYFTFAGWRTGANISASGDRSVQMLKFLTSNISSMDLTGVDYTIKENTFQTFFDGSFAYSWEVGDYHFIQLHNYPSYENSTTSYFSADIRKYFIDIRPSLSWLEQDLIRAGSKKVIINQHIMSNDTAWQDKFNPQTAKVGFEEYQKILGRYPNIMAIFAGHFHEWADDENYGGTYNERSKPSRGIKTKVQEPGSSEYTNGRVIPVIYSGSAQFSKYLLVQFTPDEMKVWTIDSTDGKAPFNPDPSTGWPGIVHRSEHSISAPPPPPPPPPNIPPPPPPPPPPVKLVIEELSTDQAGRGLGSVDLAPDPASTIGGNDYVQGTSVTLTAQPADGSEFANWAAGAADCGASRNCTITMTADTHVQAYFKPKPVLILESQGDGIVGSTPSGQSCSNNADCTLYATNDVVNLTATANSRSSFERWEGDPDCSDGSVTMDASKRCTAVFSKSAYQVSIYSDAGTVLSESSSSINCGVDCTEIYPANGGAQTLVLAATPDPGTVFVRWHGDEDCTDEDESDGDPQRIRLTVGASDLSCSAMSVPAGTEYGLTITKLGVRGATITATAMPAADSSGIDCPLASCAQSYPVNTVVELSVKPVRGSIFEGWDGDPDCVDGQVTLTSNVLCSARFTAKILLVDGSDDGASRTEYISVLNALNGTDYDEWSVGSPSSTRNPDGRAEPNASDLASYGRVVWYTGDASADTEFSPVAGPSPGAEQHLAEYLDAGGCLLLSSPQYLVDRGLTSFGEEYLGITGVISTTAQTQVVGSGLIEGFTSLGTLQLSHDDAGLDPLLTNSAIIQDPALGNDVLLQFGNEEEAGVIRDNGIYRSAFFSFPFLALESGTSRNNVMGAFLDYCLQIEPDDVFEANDDFDSPTGLQGGVDLTELRILPGNADLFRWEADWNADTRFRIGFTHASGDLAIEIYDQAKQLVASAQSADDGEEIVIEDVSADQLYFIRVYGVGDAANSYSLAVSMVGFQDGDQDGDGIADSVDTFSTNPLEQSDADGDGIGDNTDEDDDNDGMLDSYEIEHGLNPKYAADAAGDSDLDGFSNLEESKANTDPQDKESTPPDTSTSFSCDGANGCVIEIEETSTPEPEKTSTPEPEKTSTPEPKSTPVPPTANNKTFLPVVIR